MTLHNACMSGWKVRISITKGQQSILCKHCYYPSCLPLFRGVYEKSYTNDGQFLRLMEETSKIFAP